MELKEIFKGIGKFLLIFIWVIALFSNTIYIAIDENIVNAIMNFIAIGISFPTIIKWIKSLIN